MCVLKYCMSSTPCVMASTQSCLDVLKSGVFIKALVLLCVFVYECVMSVVLVLCHRMNYSGIGPVHFLSPSFRTGTTLCTGGLVVWLLIDTCTHRQQWAICSYSLSVFSLIGHHRSLCQNALAVCKYTGFWLVSLKQRSLLHFFSALGQKLPT